jgi:hypothetical protein
MRAFRFLVCLVGSASALAFGCATTPVGYAHPEAPGVVIITQQEAARHELKPTALSVPFSGEEDETKLLVSYLEEARRRGATYVSDVSFFTVRDGEGSTEECRTSVYPEEQVVERAVPAEYHLVTTTKPVRHLVAEPRNTCSSVSTSGSKTATSECHTEPAGHTVTSYDFQLEWQIVPAHLESVSTQRLKQAAPLCRSLQADQATRRDNRIEGIAYASAPGASH